MNILYLCTFYHRAMLFRQQMDSLIAKGHTVKAFNSAQYGEGVAEKFRPLMDNLVVHRECWNKLDRMLFFPRQWKIEKQLKSAYDLSRFDLLHSHLLLSSGYTAIRIKKKYGLPYVVSVRATDLSGFIRIPYFRKMAVRIIKESSGVLFLSKSHKQELAEKFLTEEEAKMLDSKSAVIGNCLENFWKDNTAQSGKSIDKNTIRLLTVAKIKPIKNIPMAARAVEELRRRGYNASLTVIGENQDNAEYQKIKAYDCVRLLPFMNKEELINAYGENDIFLLPSVNETFGRVYLEAMSQGLPVIYTRGQGFDNTFAEGEAGYSVACDNPVEIADRIEDIIGNYKQISANCVSDCKLFYEENIMNRLEQFYQDSLSRALAE